MKEKVIIDTDPGIDDALALLLACQSPELEIAAFTTVCGNVAVDMATRNVFMVLSQLYNGSNPYIVARGASAPLQKEPFFATYIHGRDGLGDLDRFRDPGGKPRYRQPEVKLSPRDAADEILNVIHKSFQPVTLISLGPLTNLALALDRDKETMHKINKLILMGGAVGVSGNITPAAEFNIFFDPQAARKVFSAGLPLVMVGLDVTRRVCLDQQTLEKKACEHTGAVGQFLLDSTKNLFEQSLQMEERASFPLHDPLAVAVAIKPDLVDTEDLNVQVETKGELTEGMTVADRRPIRDQLKNPPNVKVCTEVHSRSFISFFLERILCRK